MSNPGITSSPAVKGGPAADPPPFSSHQPTHSAMPVMPPPPDPPKPSKKQEQKSTGLLTETVGPIGHFVVSIVYILINLILIFALNYTQLTFWCNI